nr:putative uncharacterized protein DDB_G0277255 [Nothobranchius furzeri]
MKEAGQHYVWTTKLVENVNRPNTLWLIRKRLPAPDLSKSRPLVSRFKSPDALDTLSNIPLSSSSSSSSESSSSPSLCCSCCSLSKSDSTCSSSSSSSLSSCSSPSSAVSKHDPALKTWNCELVKGHHHKIIIRRQLSDSSVPRTKTASQPEIGKHSSELQRTKNC